MNTPRRLSAFQLMQRLTKGNSSDATSSNQLLVVDVRDEVRIVTGNVSLL